MKFSKQLIFWLLVLFSALLYINLSYYTLRSDTIFLLSQVALLFIILGSIWFLFSEKGNSAMTFSQVQIAGILLRLTVLFSIPNLSDDFYRFLWDGYLSFIDINPYMSRPADIMSDLNGGTYLQELYAGLNSPNYFTVYPPLNQFIFAFSNFLFPEGIYFQVLTLKSMIFLAEVATIFMLPNLLKSISVNKSLSILYILNPLVIIETVGNLHFEAMTITFLILALSFLMKRKYLVSSIFFGLAISVKLVPLILLPFLFRYLSWKKGFIYGLISGLVFVIMFLPYLSFELIENVYSSINLYYQSFEFNASLYYLIRYLGFLIKGYNIIHFAGPFLALCMMALFLFIFIKQKAGSAKDLFNALFWSTLIFYLFSTTVHPWYLINVLFIAVIAGYGYSVSIWTIMAFLSYAAYRTDQYNENLTLIFVEYVIFVLALMYEYRLNRKKDFTVPIEL